MGTLPGGIVEGLAQAALGDPTQGAQTGEKEVVAAAGDDERRESKADMGRMSARRVDAARNHEFALGLLVAGKRIAVVTLPEVAPIVHPPLLDELELVFQARVQRHENHAVLGLIIPGLTFGGPGAVGTSAADDPPSRRQLGRQRRIEGTAPELHSIARIGPPDVSAQRAAESLGIVAVAEVGIGLRHTGITLVGHLGRKGERRAIGPSPHQLRSEQFRVAVSPTLLLQEPAEGGDLLVELAIGHERAVAEEAGRRGRRRNLTLLVDVPEQELAGCDRGPVPIRERLAQPARSLSRARRPGTRNGWIPKAIGVAEVLAGLRLAVHDAHGSVLKCLLSDAPGLRHAAIEPITPGLQRLRCRRIERDPDMDLARPPHRFPPLRRALTPVREQTGPRQHSLPEIEREGIHGRAWELQCGEPAVGESDVHGGIRLVVVRPQLRGRDPGRYRSDKQPRLRRIIDPKEPVLRERERVSLQDVALDVGQLELGLPSARHMKTGVGWGAAASSCRKASKAGRKSAAGFPWFDLMNASMRRCTSSALSTSGSVYVPYAATGNPVSIRQRSM